MVGFASGAVATANSLEVTQARVQALAGSTERYNEILRLAKSGQQAYGGTLEENVAALGGFVNMSNRTGVAIDTLDNAARRLAAADPVQGIEGASVALREFLTGTGAEAVVSLAERFELPKQALAELAQAGVSTQQRMAGLNTLLNDLGYTNEFLAASADTTAASYGRLWQRVEQFHGDGGKRDFDGARARGRCHDEPAHAADRAWLDRTAGDDRDRRARRGAAGVVAAAARGRGGHRRPRRTPFAI